MNSLEAVQARLLAQGVSTSTGTGSGSTWPCFRGFLPDQPDQCIAVQYTGGFPQDEHGGANLLQTFQVAVRAGQQQHAVAEGKWLAMFDALQDSQGAANMTDFNLVQAQNTGPLYFLDEKNRPMFVCNFRAVRTRT